MPKKQSEKKGKKRKDSESSTPETSTQSVDDDTQELLQSGAGASRADKKTKKESLLTRVFHQNPNTTSSDPSGHSSAQSGPSTDPGTESSTNPSKKPGLSPFQKLLGKVSPNRLSCPNCSPEDENHKPECPKSKNVAVDVKGAFGGARPKEFTSKGARPKEFTSKKNKDGTQSSSSSDPSVGDYFAGATDSEQSSKTSTLLHPNQGEVHASPQKTNFMSRKKLQTPTKELKRPKERSHATNLKKTSEKEKTLSPNRTMSEASASSSSSNSTSNNSLLSRLFNSISPNKSDPKGKHPLKGPSDNKSSKASKNAAGSSRDLPNYDQLLKLKEEVERLAQQAGGGSDAIIQDDTILIDQMDVERRGLMPRLRSRSHLPQPDLEPPPDPTPNTFDFSDMNIQVCQIGWEWLEEQRQRDREARARRAEKRRREEERRRDRETRGRREEANDRMDREERRRRQEEANDRMDREERRRREEEARRLRDRNERRDPNEARGAAVEENEQRVRRNALDETEQVLLRQVGAVRRNPVVRHESSSPVRVRACNCGAEQGHNAWGHRDYCVQIRDARARRRRRRDGNSRSRH